MSIIIKNLSFSYKKDYVLKNISLNIEEKSFVALLGKNGVGKSTLFKCILGLLNIKKDTVFIDNIDITKIPKKIIAQKIAYIPQVHSPHFNYKVIDVVVMGLGSKINLLSSPKKSDYQLAKEILNELGILDIMNKGYIQISGGQRQLVMIARALLQDAKILLMDEPTSNLDYGNQISIVKKIKSLSKKGYTVIISTHNPQHALTFADKSLILKDGFLLDYGDTKDIINEDILKSIYNIDVDIKYINSSAICIPKL